MSPGHHPVDQLEEVSERKQDPVLCEELLPGPAVGIWSHNRTVSVKVTHYPPALNSWARLKLKERPGWVVEVVEKLLHYSIYTYSNKPHQHGSVMVDRSVQHHFDSNEQMIMTDPVSYILAAGGVQNCESCPTVQPQTSLRTEENTYSA